MFGLPDVESYAVAAQIDFYAINVAKYPLGSVKRSQERLGKLDGIPALLYTIDLFRQGTEAVLGDLPAACQEVGVEALLIDQVLFVVVRRFNHCRISQLAVYNHLQCFITQLRTHGFTDTTRLELRSLMVKTVA
ncbi:hypothetical protein C7B62_15220 [Pleurocapsa sp. CCALA 161]|uniref:hypothetical protein n=1 Tax=Pleurocapsa sp. CCALA 161 TaxID=2107688 RepID=UPI000D05CE68|nr:hypothetical protein [Pleurocapsa sp. CCALA 161]PSB08855.1 hypothetical protein C7B62_15220 [Pleurocapsa sp. CCALA 161]